MKNKKRVKQIVSVVMALVVVCVSIVPVGQAQADWHFYDIILDQEITIIPQQVYTDGTNLPPQWTIHETGWKVRIEYEGSTKGWLESTYFFICDLQNYDRFRANQTYERYEYTYASNALLSGAQEYPITIEFAFPHPQTWLFVWYNPAFPHPANTVFLDVKISLFRWWEPADLRIDTPDISMNLDQGETTSIPMEITNYGGEAGTATLFVVDTEDVHATVSADSISIEGGGVEPLGDTEHVTINVQVSDTATGMHNVEIQLMVDATVQDTLTLLFNVRPVSTPETTTEELQETLPATTEPIETTTVVVTKTEEPKAGFIPGFTVFPVFAGIVVIALWGKRRR